MPVTKPDDIKTNDSDLFFINNNLNNIIPHYNISTNTKIYKLCNYDIYDKYNINDIFESLLFIFLSYSFYCFLHIIF